MNKSTNRIEYMRPLLFIVVVIFGLLGIAETNGVKTIHGAVKVAVGVNGHPWIVTNDGAIYGYDGSVWEQIEPPFTAEDLELCDSFLVILTKPDANGIRSVKSRNIHSTTWETYPTLGSPPGAVGLKQVACHSNQAIVLATPPNYGIFMFDRATLSWRSIHDAATWMSVMNGELFYTYPNTSVGNVWTRAVDGGPYRRWGDTMVADKIAGDANGYPWVVTSATSNPIYRWNTDTNRWTFGPPSGPVYDIDIQSYVKMFIVSDPQAVSGGYTVYSHDLYSGDWTMYSLPSY